MPAGLEAESPSARLEAIVSMKNLNLGDTLFALAVCAPSPEEVKDRDTRSREEKDAIVEEIVRTFLASHPETDVADNGTVGGRF